MVDKTIGVTLVCYGVQYTHLGSDHSFLLFLVYSLFLSF